MPKTLINITQQAVLQEIEQVLEQYPDHPYQQAFAHPDVRQELLAWVLNRIPNNFTLLESLEAQKLYSADAPYCYAAILIMENQLELGGISSSSPSIMKVSK